MREQRLFVTDGKADLTAWEQRADFCRPSGRICSAVTQQVRSFLCLLTDRQHERNDLCMKKVGIIMGSDSDLPVVEKAIDTLKEFGVPYEVHVFSAHRTPVEAADFSKNARERGFGAIIAAAGKAAHLAGAIAANTTLPVIGIPVKSSTLDGLDALLSTVQMPSGIPVATVAIDGAANAALLSMQILAVSDKELADKLDASRKAASDKVLEKNKVIEDKFNN
jgi:5-(carboxyamino)imidazole ribonucleotide mutase